MPKKWIWMGSGLGVLCSIFIFAPASWLAGSLAYASSGQVMLLEPRGTVWAGSSELVLTGGGGSVSAIRLPSRLAWHMSPTWFGVQLRLESACCTRTPAQVNLAWERGSVTWTLQHASLTLPAELLAGLGAPWNTLQLVGDLTLTSEQFSGLWSASTGFNSISGQATLQIDNIATALSTVRPLGSYRLTATGASFRLDTASSEAPLQLTGNGQIENGSAHFQGEALAAVGREEALSNLLHIIGQWQAGSDGRMRSLLKLGT